jgi:hypothetical protein
MEFRHPLSPTEAGHKESLTLRCLKILEEFIRAHPSNGKLASATLSNNPKTLSL